MTHNLKKALTSNISLKLFSVILGYKRAYLRDLETAELAIHIDGQTLKAGKNNITISNEELFLPNSIKLVHYTPTTIAVYLDN
jgi:chaperone required for assembly of F1-ATPase